MSKVVKMKNIVANPELSLILQIVTCSNGQNLDFDDLSNINWDYLIWLSIKHRLPEQIFQGLKHCTQVPRSAYSRLKSIVMNNKLALLKMSAETIKISRIFDDAGINYLIVKGIPLAIDLYGGYDLRLCKDIDILIDINDLDKAHDVLVHNSYILTIPNYQLAGFKKDYYLKNKHDLTFVNKVSNVEVELHFKLECLIRTSLNINEVTSKHVLLNNNKINTLSDDYNLLYLIIHGAIHAWSRLRWLNDIQLYVKQQKCDLDNVVYLAKKSGVYHLLCQALWLIRDIYGVETAKTQLVIKNMDTRSLKLAIMAKQFIFSDYELTSGIGVYSKMFFKYRLYLFKMANSGMKTKVIFGDIFKIEKIFPHITLPNKLSIFYYVLYPICVIKYIIKGKWSE